MAVRGQAPVSPCQDRCAELRVKRKVEPFLRQNFYHTGANEMSGSDSLARSPIPEPVGEPDRQKLLEIMGPGLIAGASDDDPSGIATYSQAGAQFGYGLGWTLLFTYPLMCAIQLISAEIGRVTGRGLAGNLRRYFPASLLYGIVFLLLVANVINIGADLGAMAAALRLLVGGPLLLYVAMFAVVTVLLEVFARYSRYVSVLKWLSLSLFAYVATVFVVGVPWGQVATALVLPDIKLNGEYLTVLVAILGTTISPYLFFWQAEEEVEDELEDPEAHALKDAPAEAPRQMERMRLDTIAGMGFSNLVALFIVITTAATLNAAGHTDIQTSAEAAEALRPLAGNFAFALFALGIIGTGMLALPVLAGSAAYAVGEALQWPVGLARLPNRAKAFYGTIAAATAVGALLNFTAIDPIKALFWSAVVNGVVAVPVMVMMMVMASRREVMGQFVLGVRLRSLGWVATGVMLLAAVGMFATW
jgi:NRAMP (natural resistance-associated macrophage protein)-like metal ion transporter